MQKGFGIFLLLLLPSFVASQNLVPNPSFEDIINCPEGPLPLYKSFNEYCPPWIAPTDGSPDIFSSCSLYGFNSLPSHYLRTNLFDSSLKCFGYQKSITGENHAMFYIASNAYLHREYLQVPLLDSLSKGTIYKVSYHINIHDCSGFFISDFGAYLSVDPPRRYDPDPTIDPCQNLFCPELVPQVRSEKGIIRDTSGWVEISGYFKALGGEMWLTIGSFKNVFSEWDTVNSAVPWLGVFVDDVSVTSIGRLTNNGPWCEGDSVSLQVEISLPFYWSTRSNGSDTFSLSTDLNFVPDSSMTFYLFSSGEIVDTVNIDIRQRIQGLQIDAQIIKCIDSTLSLQLPSGISYLLNQESIPANFRIEVEGDYHLKAFGTGYCDTGVNFTVRDSKINEQAFDSTDCLAEGKYITLEVEDLYTSYLWEPGGTGGPAINVYKAGRYNLRLTDANSCLHELNYRINESCDVMVFIPNAFSPGNRDTLNAVFRPVVEFALEYHIRIYNRWGQQVFESSDTEVHWDGSFQGQPCSQDVYFYMIEYSGYRGTELITEKDNGIIHLLR